MNYAKLKFYHWPYPDIHYQLKSIDTHEYVITWYEDGELNTEDRVIYTTKEIEQYLSSGIWRIVNN